MILRASCLAAGLLSIAATGAHAGMCDYRLSALVGSGGRAVANVGGAALDATGISGKALGYYTLTNAVTGANLLGAGGAAATSAEVIAGAGTGIGAAGAALMTPLGIAIGVVVAAGVAGSEGYCYFQDERITDYDEIMTILEGLAANADPAYFQLVDPATPLERQAIIQVGDGSNAFTSYRVEDLYIVNGDLKHRERLRDTTIGTVRLDVVPIEE
ncbi:hypothetical protein EU805_03120 [Salipiger sp. IMCC34102]|uniref:hypothetical protein n=1 Tax=Salipiger sp. IMCC34102 TaxID=2510647 RepID=UPI00101D3DEF|nr:hypothetical protein [Salipiger sp. IMCC34102]RYH04375.1 hypothetical protein EU805_03120 [Salipiger sp. IMCC34102]